MKFIKSQNFMSFTLQNSYGMMTISPKKMLEAHLDQTNDIASRNKKFFDKSLEFISQHFNINSKLKICDFGCGPGLYTSQLAKLGAKITGIDFSKRSIKYAEDEAMKRKQNIDYIYQNYLEFDTDEKFDLILLIQRDYTALNNNQRKILLNKFKKLLSPNGLVLMDLYSEKIFNSLKEDFSIDSNKGGTTKEYWSNFWSNDPHYVFNSTYKYDSNKVSLNKHTVFEQNRSFTIFNWAKYFSLDTIKKEINSEGLDILEYYSNICGEKYNQDRDEFAIIVGLK